MVVNGIECRQQNTLTKRYHDKNKNLSFSSENIIAFIGRDSISYFSYSVRDCNWKVCVLYPYVWWIEKKSTYSLTGNYVRNFNEWKASEEERIKKWISIEIMLDIQHQAPVEIVKAWTHVFSCLLRSSVICCYEYNEYYENPSHFQWHMIV